MNGHPYFRAFLAGILIPTFVMPVFLAAFIILRIVLSVPVPVEQAFIFPMGVVPILWGVWNMLWWGSRGKTGLPVGIHGAALPVLLLPLGTGLAYGCGALEFAGSGVHWFQTAFIPYVLIVPCILAAVAAYYLVWKYAVGWVNRELGIG